MRYRLLLLCVFSILGASAAYAHAHVESSDPEDGQVLSSPPSSMTITFSEKLRLDESQIKIFDTNKKEVIGLVKKTGEEDDTLTYALPALPKGMYTAKWKAVCLCTDHHATNGNIKFTVK